MSFFKRIGSGIKTGYQKTKETYRKTAPIRRGVASAVKTGYRGSVVAAKGLARDVRDIRMAGSIRTPRRPGAFREAYRRGQALSRRSKAIKYASRFKVGTTARFRQDVKLLPTSELEKRLQLKKYAKKSTIRIIKKELRKRKRGKGAFGTYKESNRTIETKKVNRFGNKSPYVAGYREVPRKVGGKWKVERTPIIKYKRKNHFRKIKKIKRSSYRNDDPFGVWGNFRYSPPKF